MTGPMGAGKTTFSIDLAQALGLAHIEADALTHANPGLSPEAVDRLRESVRAALAASPGGWLFDGNQDRVLDIVLGEADTLIWLRIPFRVAYSRLARRTFKRLVTREVLWGSHREEWRTLLRWYSPLGLGVILWRGHHRKTRGRILRAKPGMRVVILRSPGEVSRYLADVEVEGANEGALPGFL